jgi:NAD(P)-dependent dehydrogenase (short-subunit alcohol dehydrogenase family)
MGRHTGKVAVCAGSATGMGAETAFRLATEGAAVTIGDVNLEAAEALVERIRAAGGDAVAQAFDIADEASVNDLIQGAARRHGGLDIMHVNAADLSIVRKDKDALRTELAVFDRSLEVGLRGHLLATRAAIPLMQQRGRGAIVYTSSNAAKSAAPIQVSYYVTKAALNGLMRHVATRWGPEGIRANAICPGMVLTETILRNAPEAMLEHARQRTPSPRLGESRDIAALVSFLLSDEAEWINGQAISIDGGSLMQGG